MGDVVDGVEDLLDRRDVAVWAGLLAAGLAFELHELAEGERGVPLTRIIRKVFRTHTSAGAATFEAVVAVGSAVLVRHIVKPR